MVGISANTRRVPWHQQYPIYPIFTTNNININININTLSSGVQLTLSLQAESVQCRIEGIGVTLCMDLIAVVDDPRAGCAALKGPMIMAGVCVLGQRSAAVFAVGSGDQRAGGVDRRLAVALGDECRSGSDEEKER